MCFRYLGFDTDPNQVGSYCKIRSAHRPGGVCKMIKQPASKHCPKNLHGNLCCVSSCSKHHCVWWVSTEALLSGQTIFKFHILHGISGVSGLPTCLILHEKITSLGATSKERQTKHTWPVLIIYNSECNSIFNPGEVVRGIFRPHKNLFFSSLHISWNYNKTVHIPFATFLPLS